MSKQEEIEGRIATILLGVAQHTTSGFEATTQILEYLHSQGVVIKVDRELTQEFLDGLEGLLDPSSEYYYKLWTGIGITQVKNFIKEQTGYVAVEPLIKE